jgi:hypothetical protein
VNGAAVSSHQTSPSTRTRPIRARQSSIADAVTTSHPIELANVFALTTGPNGLWPLSSAQARASVTQTSAEIVRALTAVLRC